MKIEFDICCYSYGAEETKLDQCSKKNGGRDFQGTASVPG